MGAIIITGHGNFATGIKSMLDLVVGEIENTYFIDFTQDLSSEDLKVKFLTIYEHENGQVLFLCDIAGGTPFNQAAMLMHSKNKNYGVIGGINIPLILDILDSLEITLNDNSILLHAREIAYENIKIFGEEKQNSSENISEDGI
ncbi:MAG: PTS fructose transporter subunit IIA [Brevinema sp.]